jgi:hypothetical protein
MIRLATRMSSAVVSLLLLALPASVAQADSCVRPQGTLHSKPVSADGSLRAFTGDVTPFGPIAGVLTLHINPDGSFTGRFAFEGRRGVAYGTLVGQFIMPNTYVEQLTFTGGTGKYAGISGYADVMGTLNPDGTGTDTVEDGQICLR